MAHELLEQYSSHVELSLVLDGVRYSVSHVWRNGFILRDEREISEKTAARLIIAVDGVETVQDIFIHRFDPLRRSAEFF